MTPTDKPIRTVESRLADEEDLYYLELARNEFTESFRRIEETAKYLIGALGAVAGLYLTGLQVKIAIEPTLKETIMTLPLWVWAVSLLCAVLVVFPLPYRHGKGVPAEIKRSLGRARWTKWVFLLLSVLLFGAGLVIAALQF